MAPATTKSLGACLLFLLFSSTIIDASSSTTSKRSALRKSIFSQYDKLVHPDSQVTVSLSLSVLDLSYCPGKQEVTVRAWPKHYWSDSRLTWNPSDWDGIESLSLPTTELWMPDIALYNSVSQNEPNYNSWEKTTRVLLFSDGKVIFVPPMTFKGFCSAASKSDDHNNNNCTFKFGSWVHEKKYLDLQPDISQGGKAIDFDELENSRVKIVSSAVTRSEPEYPCCPGMKFPRLDFNIIFNVQKKDHHGGCGKGSHDEEGCDAKDKPKKK